MATPLMDLNNELGFTFERDSHIYRDAAGLVRLSITQMLTLCGIFDYSGIPQAVLENAARRGTNVHRWTAEVDLHGDVDDTWMRPDEVPYVEAWKTFRRETGFRPRDVEKSRMVTINGYTFGGTPDVTGFMPNDSMPWVVERKACAQVHPGWAIQTAFQEMLQTGRPRVGHFKRAAVQLKPDATYKGIDHDDPLDGQAALSVLAKFAAEESIRNWKTNHGLRTVTA